MFLFSFDRLSAHLILTFQILGNNMWQWGKDMYHVQAYI